MTLAKKINLSLMIGAYACIITSSASALAELEVTDFNWKIHEFSRYQAAGRNAYENKEFAKAAEYLERALCPKTLTGEIRLRTPTKAHQSSDRFWDRQNFKIFTK
jgi:uncharacterized protein HemY